MATPDLNDSLRLSAESLALIDVEVAKYPADQKQSAVMGALRIAQTECGWLKPELIEYVADYLEMPAIAAYEVATFYNMYDTQRPGRLRNATACNPTALQGRTTSPSSCPRAISKATRPPRILRDAFAAHCKTSACLAPVSSVASTR